MNSGELSAILDDIVASIGEILVTHAELTEGMVDDAATNTAKASLERLKKKTDAAKKKLAALRDRQRHKREVERQRKENERQRGSQQNESKNSGTVTLRDASGRTIGFMRQLGPSHTDFFDRAGKLVAREVGDVTYNASGRAVFRGRLGLAALGRLLR